MRGATSLGGRWQAANPVEAYISAVNCFRNARILNAIAQPLIEIEQGERRHGNQEMSLVLPLSALIQDNNEDENGPGICGRAEDLY